MKKILLSLTILAATSIAQATHAASPSSRFNDFAKTNAVRTLKSITDCAVTESTAVEVLVSAQCVDEKITTALAHLNSDTYIGQISDRIERTFNYYQYSASYRINVGESNPDLTEDSYVLSYTSFGKLANKAEGRSNITLEDAVDAAVQEIEMFR